MMSIHFAIVKFILATYLIHHFIGILPYADELLGDNILYDPKLGPTYDMFPNILCPILMFLTISRTECLRKSFEN